ncbi:SUKH-4 family immunity protein [Streptomyces sediminimaris]|uniref:SUKH-4 family immunity protein n=1 Tax=Streptomyces sediminimaris TaxID=3383721 RepID=UPI003999DB07
MSTTGAATAAITRSADRLGPYVTHAPTPRRPAGPGLPGGHHLFTLGEPRGQGPRTVGDATGGPDGRLTPRLGEQSVTGALPGPRGTEGEPALPEGATGAASTTYFRHGRPDPRDERPEPADGRPDPMAGRPPAPSLATLVRFAAAADELAGLRARLASCADRHGPRAAAEEARRLLAVFEEAAGGEIPPFRKAALIRPPSLPAGPGAASGLALDLPARLLDRAFGPGRMWRFEDVDFPATLTHEPTRRFLRETGLPEDDTLLGLGTDVPLPTLAEHYAHQGPDGFGPALLPCRAARLIRLGHLAEGNSLVVDGATGEVLDWSEPEATLYPLNRDVSTLAVTLLLLDHERAVRADVPGGPAADARGRPAARTVIHTRAALDATATTADPARHAWMKAVPEEGAGPGVR